MCVVIIPAIGRAVFVVGGRALDELIDDAGEVFCEFDCLVRPRFLAVCRAIVWCLLKFDTLEAADDEPEAAEAFQTDLVLEDAGDGVAGKRKWQRRMTWLNWSSR